MRFTLMVHQQGMNQHLCQSGEQLLLQEPLINTPTKFFNLLRQVPFLWHVGGLCARERIYWMNWNGLQRPLKLPFGYKQCHAEKEKLPGLKAWGIRPRNMDELTEASVLLWTVLAFISFPSSDVTKSLTKLKGAIGKWTEVDFEEEKSSVDETAGNTKRNQWALCSMRRTGREWHKNGRIFADSPAGNRENLI